jgi:hypothetical protein
VFVLIHFYEELIHKDFKGDIRGHTKELIREFWKDGGKVDEILGNTIDWLRLY